MKNEKAMFALSYGLFVLAAREGERDNGCIINTAMQVTVTPNRILFTVDKSNLTHDMVGETGLFTCPFSRRRPGSGSFSASGSGPAGTGTSSPALPGPSGGRTASCG